MRTPDEIIVNGRSLADILAEAKRTGEGANLAGANLSDANLVDANLAGANLRGANLYGAYLLGANLVGANLVGANLYGAYLAGANLWGAYLADAYLKSANLAGANLAGAVGILSAGPIGSRGDMTYIVQHKTCLMVKCGCFWGTLDEFAAKVEGTHGDNQHGRAYRALIALAKAKFGIEVQS